MKLRSPIVAMLWETWRVTRVEAAWKLGLVVVVPLAALSLSERGVVVPDSFTDTPGQVVMPPKSNTASSRPSTIAGTKPSPTALTNPRDVAEQGSTPEGR